MPKAKITKSFVDSVPLSAKGQTAYCDSDLRGFYLIVGTESKTYAAQKDIQGRSIRCTIGRHGHFTPEQARKIAKDKLYLMAQGIDPNVEENKQRTQNITLVDVLKSYQDTRKNLSERTKNDYKYYLEKYVPEWLPLRMTDITKEMVVERHNHIGENNGKRVANGTMRILRSLFNHAHATYDICEINPVAHLSKIKAWYPEVRRRSYVKLHQLKTWWDGVHALGSDTYRDFFLLLLFTGLRRNEAASLRWENIDFKDKTFTIPRTKNGDHLTLPLGDFLLNMFTERKKRYGNYEYVFPGTGKQGYLAEPKKGVYKVIASTGIQFTCHDMRRTFITIAESLEISAYALKRLINHRATDVTSGYIIVDVERLRSPVQKIEAFILEKINGDQKAGNR